MVKYIFTFILLLYISLYLNVCFGEAIEMQRWVSESIVPLCLILLFLYVSLYFTTELINRFFVKIITIFLIILVVIYLAIGIAALILGTTTKLEELRDTWNLLSSNSQLYYYENDIHNLYNGYYMKMVVTGSLYLTLFIIVGLLSIFNIQFYKNLDNNWRPPLKSRLNDDRAERYINYYAKYNKDYKPLVNTKNKGGELNKLELVDDVSILNNRQIGENKVVMQNQNNNITDNHKDEFVVVNNNEENVNKNENIVNMQDNNNNNVNENVNNENAIQMNNNEENNQNNNYRTGKSIRNILRRKK
jgi:hypothetical protein